LEKDLAMRAPFVSSGSYLANRNVSMSLKTAALPLIPQSVRRIYRTFSPNEDINQFSFGSNDGATVSRDIVEKWGFEGDLLEFFTGNEGAVVHKWHHYIPLYDRYLARYRGRKIRFLEIGVSKGGSLQMWRKYFGDEAVIFGIDIDPNCAKFDGLAGQVRIGSQTDPGFLRSVVDEMGGLDVVLDDGSHHMHHIPATLKTLFGSVTDGGLYMIEDLHGAYWKRLGGGYRSKSNFFGVVRELIDDMHHWYHGHELIHPAVSAHCSGVHVHDSIVVLEKDRVFRPVHSRIGREAG
jgi:hypothetical protein